MQSPKWYVKKVLAQAAFKLREQLYEQASLRREYDRVKAQVAVQTPGNPAVYGYKIYSQCDEDGIIAYIFSRIGEGDRVFVEIGCSDGLENNSHALVLNGWRGAWFDADSAKIKSLTNGLPANSRLLIEREFASPANVCSIVDRGLRWLNVSDIDFLSIDIDGDDINVLATVLKKIKPRVICTEYNAKFPPPMKISICTCPETGGWAGDDYQGASLCSFTDRLRGFGYRLIACNLSGVNAFFVRVADADKFPDFTTQQLYQPARYYLRRIASGHPPSLKFLANAVRSP
jgi:hypothetical protein